MKQLKIADIRAAVKSLRGSEIHPNIKIKLPLWKPRLEGGIVYAGICALHPATFLDFAGEDVFRAIPRDVSKAQIEKFIKQWKKTKVKNDSI